jgi:hypothetical protein
VTMSSIEDCNAVIENLDGKVRSSLSLSLSLPAAGVFLCVSMHVIGMIDYLRFK